MSAATPSTYTFDAFLDDRGFFDDYIVQVPESSTKFAAIKAVDYGKLFNFSDDVKSLLITLPKGVLAPFYDKDTRGIDHMLLTVGMQLVIIRDPKSL
jgi:hypothetical protein